MMPAFHDTLILFHEEKDMIAYVILAYWSIV